MVSCSDDRMMDETVPSPHPLPFVLLSSSSSSSSPSPSPNSPSSSSSSSSRCSNNNNNNNNNNNVDDDNNDIDQKQQQEKEANNIPLISYSTLHYNSAYPISSINLLELELKWYQRTSNILKIQHYVVLLLFALYVTTFLRHRRRGCHRCTATRNSSSWGKEEETLIGIWLVLLFCGIGWYMRDVSYYYRVGPIQYLQQKIQRITNNTKKNSCGWKLVIYLWKLGVVHEVYGNYQEAKDCYKQIVDHIITVMEKDNGWSNNPNLYVAIYKALGRTCCVCHPPLVEDAWTALEIAWKWKQRRRRRQHGTSQNNPTNSSNNMITTTFERMKCNEQAILKLQELIGILEQSIITHNNKNNKKKKKKNHTTNQSTMDELSQCYELLGLRYKAIHDTVRYTWCHHRAIVLALYPELFHIVVHKKKKRTKPSSSSSTTASNTTSSLSSSWNKKELQSSTVVLSFQSKQVPCKEDILSKNLITTKP